MYEHRNQPQLTRGAFFLRMLCHLFVDVAFVGVSLSAGMIGYWILEHNDCDMKTWYDAFLNAAMLLGGMGPVHTPTTDGGKVFAGLYALYAGLVFLVAAALLLTPVFHWLLHTFHWEQSVQNVRPHRAAPSGESRADQPRAQPDAPMRSIYAVNCSDCVDECCDRGSGTDPGGQANRNITGTSISFPLPSLPRH